YGGPTINANHTLTTPEVFQQVFNWFNANGGRSMEFLSGAVPGLSTHIGEGLKSPSVDEVTVGFGSQLTTNSYFRVDAVHKRWKDLYALQIDQTTGTVEGRSTDPTAGTFDIGTLDVGQIVNSDQFNRRYDALDFQAAVRPFSRTNIGINYTFSKLKGNVASE